MTEARGERVPELLARGHQRTPRERHATVVGGGLAGVAAALTLAERGVQVTLLEAERELGGRVASFDAQLPGAPELSVGRGFHAFFRQYYNVRRLLRRIDPALSFLKPLPDYPLLGRDGAVETFAGLPHRTPLNVIELVRRTQHLTLRDLMRVNVREALAMLTFDQERTYARYDALSARSYLDSLRFPKRARAMLFNVFAHSFFNPEEGLSAGELLMMFHFYFTGNPEGLLFDVLTQPFSSGLWTPLQNKLESLGVRVRLSTPAEQMVQLPGGRFGVVAAGERIESDWLVLALSVPALKQLVERSQALDCRPLRRSVEALSVTRPFVVWRRWLDRQALASRAAFAGTSELGALDNISLFERFEDESAQYCRAHGGSVVELHAYAVEPGFEPDALKRELWQGLLHVYPELRGAGVRHECWYVRQDCPSFAPGSYQSRPAVDTALPGLTLAGDFTRLPFPSALMERAVSSGVLAANHLLASERVQSEPLYSVPRRGVFADVTPLRGVRELMQPIAAGATR